MKAILLAAGQGTRIAKDIGGIPKSTLPIGGVPLIRRTVEQLRKKGIPSTVCAGYKAGLIADALAGTGAAIYENPFYPITNSIASLWFAREGLVGDALIMNADVFLSDEALGLLLADQRDVVMAADRSRTENGDFFFTLGENSAIAAFGKDIPPEKRSCEYVGAAKVTASFMPIFAARLDELIKGGHFGDWWENVLYSCIPEREIPTIDMDGAFWGEVDHLDDYQRITAYVNSR